MAQNYSLLIQGADNIVWDSGALHRNPKAYVTISLDNNPVSQTPVFKRSLKPKWNFTSTLLCSVTSTLTLRLYHHTFIPLRADPLLGECRILFEELLNQCNSGEAVQLKVKADGKVSGRISVVLGKIEVAAGAANDRLQSEATIGLPDLIIERLDGVVETGAAQNELATALGACLDRLDVVVKMGDKLAQVHPYVNAAWVILTSVHQAVKQQREMDDNVVELVKTMVKLYSFKDHIDFVVEKIQILEDTLIEIAKQTLECANFLQEYKQQTFSGRTIRTAFVNTNQKKIEDMSKELVNLKELFAHALIAQGLALAVETHGAATEIQETMRKLG
ncbi:hypothetical protein B0H16DRAFT_1448444 [Mycena metata]|uniref:C2 domain-containing protein n=1 Tax=Mycena metata TaxID=1033252 RepID=A0AAD7K7M3_9AGAR|nr:hypothetical protein B0H16DRAFT_1448394 [Mycena metata]KAJ7780021.1 hypothetical protein B0H16DRAFT_1448444 [Mycena metata]